MKTCNRCGGLIFPGEPREGFCPICYLHIQMGIGPKPPKKEPDMNEIGCCVCRQGVRRQRADGDWECDFCSIRVSNEQQMGTTKGKCRSCHQVLPLHPKDHGLCDHCAKDICWECLFQHRGGTGRQMCPACQKNMKHGIDYTIDDMEKDIGDIITELAALRRAKGHDYSGTGDTLDNLREFGSLGVVVRIGDKFKRLKHFYKQGTLEVADEKIEDTINDLINYALYLKIMRRQENES